MKINERKLHRIIRESIRRLIKEEKSRKPYNMFLAAKKYRMRWYSHDMDNNTITFQTAGKPQDMYKILKVIVKMDIPEDNCKVTRVEDIDVSDMPEITSYRHYTEDLPVIRISYKGIDGPSDGFGE